MEFITVDVSVGESLKQFVVDCSGADLVSPEKDSILWCLVKTHLLLRPNPYSDIPDRTGLIRLQLRHSHSGRTFSLERHESIVIDTLYRCYLDSSGQRVVRRYFDRQFKHSFRMYMKGAMAGNPRVKVSYAIAEFLLEYNIDPTAQLLAALQKDWWRYRKREDCGIVNPLVI
jgi:hypothetical protein